MRRDTNNGALQVTVELLDADSRGPDDIVAALGPAATRG